MIANKEQGKIILDYIKEIAEEKQIAVPVIFNFLKESLLKIYEKSNERKNAKTSDKAEVVINEKTGEIQLYRILQVVGNVENPGTEIALEQAKKSNKQVKIGDEYYEPVSNTEFTRLEIFQAIQLIKQSLKEAEKNSILAEFADKKGELLTGVVETIDDYYILIRVSRAYAYLPKKNQIPGQKIAPNNNFIKFYLEDFIKNNAYGQLLASRVHPNFLRRLMELEIPEFSQTNSQGKPLIEIKAVARIPGIRAKVAIVSNDVLIDAIGSCVGLKGMRIQTISQELNGEKIDIILFDEDVKNFIINALAPAKVIGINLTKEDKKADVIVPNEQYSLAIGKDGISARLVAQLTNWKINIISLEQALSKNISFIWNGNLKETEYDDFITSLREKKNFKKK